MHIGLIIYGSLNTLTGGWSTIIANCFSKMPLFIRPWSD